LCDDQEKGCIYFFMVSIPESALLFFQEYDPGHLDPERDGDLVIERTLAYGNREEVRWLLAQYGLPRVQDWLSESGLRRLPRRRYRLWSNLHTKQPPYGLIRIASLGNDHPDHA